MGFKPQKWLIESLCPYCHSDDLISDGHSNSNNEATCWWYCENCQTNFQVSYELQSLYTDRGDKYVAGKPNYKDSLETKVLKRKLIEIKVAIADEVLQQNQLNISQISSLINGAMELNKKIGSR